VSGTPVKRGSGIEVGFESFDQPAEKQRRGAATVDAALAWLARASDEPFLLWIHLFDAHWPYDAPPPHGDRYSTDSELERYIAERRIPERASRRGGASEDTRRSVNAYDAELRYQDAEVGRLLRVLRDRRDWDRTAILLLGDHGEGLSQHGEAAHDGTWHEQLHVPLLMRVPGVQPRRVARPVSLVDAMPTFLALIPGAGIELPGDRLSGRDALAADALHEPILSQDTGRKRPAAHRYAITTSRWKYFRITELDGSLREELYDLDSDPHELADVAPSHPEQIVALRNVAEARIRSQTDRGEALRGGEPPRTKPMDPQLLEQLRALGYAESPDG
jgi:arylsulfatase A-like enzyme